LAINFHHEVQNARVVLSAMRTIYTDADKYETRQLCLRSFV